MLKFIETKKTYIMALAILFVIVSLTGPTYSLFVNVDSTNTFNYTTGLLDLVFEEEEQLVLENLFPKLDSEGEEQQGYNLTLRNNGTSTYLFDLIMENTATNKIDNKYIKVKLNNKIAKTLYSNNNIIDSNIIIRPGETKTFNIKIWLDYNTPNSELGKSFIGRITTKGQAIYKTLDNSGANYPDIDNNMIPIYYKENNIYKADISNIDINNKWYDYSNKEWANIITLKNSDKYIYDIEGNNKLKLDNIKYNDTNLIVDRNINLNINYPSNKITTIMRIKVEDNNNIYLINNNTINYYYDNIEKRFIFKINNNISRSRIYTLDKDNWYILGFTYDGNIIKYYVNGEEISSNNIIGNINNTNISIGENNSKYILGDIYIYNNILDNNIIKNNYSTSINIYKDNLIYGYNRFIPMDYKEYYLSNNNGMIINKEYIDKYYVWIPRYKYRLFNVMGKNNIDIYDAYNKGIDIVFEKDNTSSGVIYCKDNICYSDSEYTNILTDNDNNKYYTHIGFNDKRGIWIDKYNNNNSNIENATIIYLSHSKYGICSDKCNTSNIETSNNNITGIYDIYNRLDRNSNILGDGIKEFSNWNYMRGEDNE